MWPDLTSVSNSIPPWSKKIEVLPRTLERFRSSVFFFDVELPSFLISNPQAKSWLAWASISSIIAIEESLLVDLKELGLSDAWHSSIERKNLRAHPLIAILKELRNFETHFHYNERKSASMDRFKTAPKSLNINEMTKLNNAFYFAPLDFAQLSQLNNIKKGNSPVNAGMVDWFNRQSNVWYAEQLVEMALEIYSDQIVSFLEHELPAPSSVTPSVS